LSHFLMEFKHLAIERFVGFQIDEKAQVLVKVALGLQEEAPDRHGEHLFVVDDLRAKCPHEFGDDPGRKQPLDWKEICNYLDVMCQDPICEMASTLHGKYKLKVRELSNAIKQMILEEVVKQKVGEAGCRLYRILLRRHAKRACTSKGQQKLELKQIAELGLMPERDARPLLMTLMQLEYVLMQEVPKTVDRNPKTTTYLWHVSLPHAYSTLEAEILKMVSHLHIRLRHECSTLPAEGAADGDDVAAMRASAKVDCLEHTLLKLHETLLLLRIL